MVFRSLGFVARMKGNGLLWILCQKLLCLQLFKKKNKKITTAKELRSPVKNNKTHPSLSSVGWLK